MSNPLTRVRLSLAIMKILLAGWANNKDGRITFGNLDRKHSGWVIYEQATNTAWKVTPDTRRNAEREAAALGFGYRPMPAALARYIKNIWAAGRYARIREERAA